MMSRYFSSYYLGLGSSLAAIGTVSYLIPRAGYATAQESRNRVYVSIRQEAELEPLLLLPRPLLANFCIYTDPTSKQLSKTLQAIVEHKTSNQVSLVDVQADEPGVRDLLPRYMVSQIPTVVAIRGGIPIDRYSLKSGEPVDEEKLKSWVDGIGK